MMTSPERLAALEQRLNDHEARCEERLVEIKATAISTLKAVEGLKGRFWTITLSVLAWALSQLWTGSQLELRHQEAPSRVMIQDISDVGVR